MYSSWQLARVYVRSCVGCLVCITLQAKVADVIRHLLNPSGPAALPALRPLLIHSPNPFIHRNALDWGEVGLFFFKRVQCGGCHTSSSDAPTEESFVFPCWIFRQNLYKPVYDFIVQSSIFCPQNRLTKIFYAITRLIRLVFLYMLKSNVIMQIT